MIFYLSGTGNTKWVAESIAHIHDDRLVDVAGETDGDVSYKLEKGEHLGFCFPVHGWRPPRLMLDFVDRMKVEGMAESGTYVFIVCTAGDTVGEAIDILERKLHKKGVGRVACYDVKMPNTYIGLPFMDVDSKDVEREKLRNAQTHLINICSDISDKRYSKDLRFIGNWPKTNSRVLGGCFVNWLVTDRHFKVDSKKCVKCGKCAEVCPVEDIEGGVGQLPKWKHNKKCMTCFACYHNCSKHAIQYGWMTHGKGQYRFGGSPKK